MEDKSSVTYRKDSLKSLPHIFNVKYTKFINFSKVIDVTKDTFPIKSSSSFVTRYERVVLERINCNFFGVLSRNV